MTTALAETPYSAGLLLAGYALALLGLALIVAVVRRSRKHPVRSTPVAAGRGNTSRAAARGWGDARDPVAAPGRTGVTGAATLVFPSLPAAPPAGGHRAGRDRNPLGSGRPGYNVRLAGAPGWQPRRARVAVPFVGSGAATTQRLARVVPRTPPPAPSTAPADGWCTGRRPPPCSGHSPGRDPETQVLARVADAPTETWKWPAASTTGH